MSNRTRLGEIDEKIDKARKHFFSAVLAKKRTIRRKFLEMTAITNGLGLETLAYRVMLRKALEDVEDPASYAEIRSIPDETDNTGITTTIKGHEKDCHGLSFERLKEQDGNDESFRRDDCSQSGRLGLYDDLYSTNITDDEEFEDVADPAGMSKYFWKASTVNES